MSPGQDETDNPMPCPDAMIAATVALMTAWADPQPRARVDASTQRSLIARKIVSNLFFLQHHPHLGTSLRQVMANARQHWLGLVERDRHSEEAATAPTTLH